MEWKFGMVYAVGKKFEMDLYNVRNPYKFNLIKGVMFWQLVNKQMVCCDLIVTVSLTFPKMSIAFWKY